MFLASMLSLRVEATYLVNDLTEAEPTVKW